MISPSVRVALIITLALGVWMRWSFTEFGTLPLDFAHLRHAHSHLGAYGVLFPLAFVAWRRVGAFAPGPRVMRVYALATVVAFVGFLRAGYGVEAIAGSTVVGGVWLWCAVQLRGRFRSAGDPLVAVPFGIVAAMSCIPFIAMNLRREPALAQHVVSTFLSALFLSVVTPSALSALGVRVRSRVLFVTSALLSAASLGIWQAWPARVGLAVFGALVIDATLRREVPRALRFAWALLGVGLLSVAIGLVPNARPAVLGALHFLVLGPVLLSLTWPALRVRGGFASALGLVAVGLLSAPLVAQAVGVVRWTMELSALGGSLVFAWWLVAVLSSRAAQPLETRP